MNTLMIILLVGIAILGAWILSGKGASAISSDNLDNVAKSSFYNK